MELFIDTETSDMIKRSLPFDDSSQPWIVQIGMILSDRDKIYSEVGLLVEDLGRKIMPGAYSVHKIGDEMCAEYGESEHVIILLIEDLSKIAHTIVCHNIAFDLFLIDALMSRYYGNINYRDNASTYCTMEKSTSLCKIPGKFGNYKWPKLQELHQFLFNEPFEDAHDALSDVRATRKCYYKMTK